MSTDAQRAAAGLSPEEEQQQQHEAALAACTEVNDRRSPPDVIELKRRQLQELGPGGWRLALGFFVLGVPAVLGAAAAVALRFFWRPLDALRAPDPRRVPPPPPAAAAAAAPPEAAAAPQTETGSSSSPPPPPYPIEEAWIEVGASRSAPIRLHAVSPAPRRGGGGGGRPLALFLHGFPECWASWRHQLLAFDEAGFDAVALDMRGYNLSDKPAGVKPYHLAELAADVRDAVAALGHRRCTLVAHDWGGSVAWVAAGLYGSALVDRLVVMALPHLGVALTNVTPKQRQRSAYMLFMQPPLLAEAMIAGGDAELLQGTFTSAATGVRNRGAVAPADVWRLRHAMCQPGAATATINYYRALLRFLALSDAGDAVWGALKAQLDMPVLVLHGADDFALGLELLDGIEAAAPAVTVKVLRRCSHWVQQDYPRQVSALALEWLAAHPPAAPAGKL